jgi:hypothetical protein
MKDVADFSEQELTRSLSYAGFVLLTYELIKSLIVNPIKAFYAYTTFGEGMTFKSYEADVMSRHKNEFEACLLYLRDFMQALDSEDVSAIQGLRRHRNELAHNLADRLAALDIATYSPLLKKADKALFKLSNYRTYIEIGSDPAYRNKGINWDTVYGREYAIFKEVLKKMGIFEREAE